MDKMKITRLSLLATAVLLAHPVFAEQAVAPQQWLMEQVRVGEASHKDDLVQQSLYRLELMDPDNPDVIAARLRLALRQGNQALAHQQLEKLQRLAPDSPVTRQAQLSIDMTTPQTQQQLQQARLLAAAGRLDEAKTHYDDLFHGQPPTVELAVEYWRLVARLPGQQRRAIVQLQALDKQYPGNAPLREALAKMLFSQHRDAEGYAVLRQLANDSEGRNPAAEMWMDNIKAIPVGDRSINALHEFIAVFGQGQQVADAQVELARQQKLLADPGYQARIKGLETVERGGSKQAIPQLQKALVETPDDADVLGAMGLAYARSGQRQKAIALFEQAQKADKNGFRSDKWRSLIASNRYWLQLNEADAALKAGNLSLAQQRYQQALHSDGSNAQPYVGLGDVAVARHDDVTAERYYRQASRIEPSNGSAVRGLAGIYQRQSPQKALDYLTHLSGSQRVAMRDRVTNLQVDVLSSEGDRYVAQQQWAQAAAKYRAAQQLSPDNVWLMYHLAQALRNAGEPQQADAAFHPLVENQRSNPEQVYAYALYLSSSERPDQALAHLRTLPTAQWSEGMHELSQRLQLQDQLDYASRLRDSGNEPAAIVWLNKQPRNTRIDLTLADWALAREDYDAALKTYQQVRVREPDNRDARLGEIEAFVGQGRVNEARQQLMATPVASADNPDSLNTQRQIAGLWNDVGEPQKALSQLQSLKPAASQAGVSQTSALVYRDSARLETQLQQPEASQQDYQRAVVASGITPALPKDNDSYTFLTRNQEEDDWLKRGIRSDAADLYHQQDVTVTLDHDYWGSSGTGGISDLAAHDTMLQVDMPYLDGRAFFRTDTVQLNAGSFSTTDGTHNEVFGACASVGCSDDLQQKTTGTSLAVGWQNDRWQGDIGTTPLGFDVVDWVGGVSYSGDWQHIGWTATASRRPVSSSLLAFAGTRDPATGTTWGGVRATGVTLSASYDRGEANGVWSNLGFHELTGENVADNQRTRFMAGYYYKLINENNRRATVGLNTMWWHFQKDLSEYSLGQGGYYSPQQYVSFSVPVNYRQRTDNWSWEVGGTVGWSHAKTSDQLRYPLQGLIPDSFADKNVIEEGGSSSGIGYTLRAIIERRLSSHWTLGAGIDIQEAKDYTPSHALIYVRYSMAGWQGDLDLPPQPLTPYADFR